MREAELVLEFLGGWILGLLFLEVVPVDRLAGWLESWIKRDP